jgi:hypothetical protein
MKRVSLFFCFLLAELLFSCLAEQENPLIVGPCKNDLRDNIITIDGTDFQLTKDNHSCYVKSFGILEVSIRKSSSERFLIDIFYGNELPQQDVQYSLVSPIELYPESASIALIVSPSIFYAKNGGHLYSRYIDKKWYFDICPTTLTASNSSVREFSGRIIYQP